MARYEFKVECIATVTEFWEMEAESEVAAREAWDAFLADFAESDPLGPGQPRFVTQDVTDERDRRVLRVRELGASRGKAMP